MCLHVTLSYSCSTCVLTFMHAPCMCLYWTVTYHNIIYATTNANKCNTKKSSINANIQQQMHMIFFFVKIRSQFHKIRSYAFVVAFNCTYTYCLTYITFMLTFPSIYALWQYICRHICLYNTCKHMPQQWQPHATTNDNKCDNKCNICHIKCKKTATNNAT